MDPEALRFRGSKGSTDSAGSGFINKWEILRVVDIFIRGFACCGVGKRLRPPEFGKWSLETLENLETNWILRELFLLGAVEGLGGISYANLTVLLVETSKIQTAQIIGSGGGNGVFNLSWGTNSNFAESARSVLEEYGFTEQKVS